MNSTIPLFSSITRMLLLVGEMHTQKLLHGVTTFVYFSENVSSGSWF